MTFAIFNKQQAKKDPVALEGGQTIRKKRPSRHWGQTTGSTSDRWGSTEEKELPMTGEPILGSQSKGTISL